MHPLIPAAGISLLCRFGSAVSEILMLVLGREAKEPGDCDIAFQKIGHKNEDLDSSFKCQMKDSVSTFPPVP